MPKEGNRIESQANKIQVPSPEAEAVESPIDASEQSLARDRDADDGNGASILDGDEGVDAEGPRPRREPLINSIPPIEYEPVVTPPPPPIATFEERGGKEFAFIGWHRVSRFSILAPNSQDLARMLDIKWSRQSRYGNVKKNIERDSSNWLKSMKFEWAVIKFEMLEGENVPPPPFIERVILLDDPEPRKSVNELLAEMRLQDKENLGRKQEVEMENSVRSRPKTASHLLPSAMRIQLRFPKAHARRPTNGWQARGC